MILQVRIPGPAVPKARARISTRGTSTPRKTVEYQARVCRALDAARIAAEWPERFDGRVSVEIVMVAPPMNIDGDNVEKIVLDAMTKARIVRDDTLRHVRGCRWYVVDEGEPSVLVMVFGRPTEERM